MTGLSQSGVRNALRDLSVSMYQTDPLATLLMRLATADLSCPVELRPADFSAAEVAMEELPDIFNAVMDGLETAIDYAKGDAT